ncbi:hypothetical protein V1264_025011 [Littorina saxatilis]|uniref:Uncharacterized protein n=2 Tax=Littorina saxatilis TaxID=31220 RepID=A0AAN9FZ80_9CAEN
MSLTPGSTPGGGSTVTTDSGVLTGEGTTQLTKEKDGTNKTYTITTPTTAPSTDTTTTSIATPSTEANTTTDTTTTYTPSTNDTSSLPPTSTPFYRTIIVERLTTTTPVTPQDASLSTDTTTATTEFIHTTSSTASTPPPPTTTTAGTGTVPKRPGTVIMVMTRPFRFYNGYLNPQRTAQGRAAFARNLLFRFMYGRRIPPGLTRLVYVLRKEQEAKKRQQIPAKTTTKRPTTTTRRITTTTPSVWQGEDTRQSHFPGSFRGNGHFLRGLPPGLAKKLPPQDRQESKPTSTASQSNQGSRSNSNGAGGYSIRRMPLDPVERQAFLQALFAQRSKGRGRPSAPRTKTTTTTTTTTTSTRPPTVVVTTIRSFLQRPEAVEEPRFQTPDVTQRPRYQQPEVTQSVLPSGPVTAESARRRFYLTNFGRLNPWTARDHFSRLVRKMQRGILHLRKSSGK